MNDPFGGASRRATRALIDLDAIADNVRIVKRAIGPNVALMAVVKANAYGHGARMVAPAAIAAGADRLGVATLDEALVLRRDGVTAPIQILGPIGEDEVVSAAERDVEISAGSMEFVRALAQRPSLQPLKVHLKVDTGLRRFGVMPADAVEAMRCLNAAPNVRIVGVFTHFGHADEVDAAPTDRQHRVFRETVNAIEAADLPTGLMHAANSGGQLRGRAYDDDLVRLGISLYGIPPSRDVPVFDGMRPAMTVTSRIQRVFDVAPGEGISYGATFRADRPIRAALVPIGYGDGYKRSLSNRGEMRLKGEVAKVLGRVCMDQTVVSIPDGVDVVVNDAITVLGGVGDDAVEPGELALLAGTNAYEIVTSVSARVPRWFVRNGETVAVEDLAGLHASF